MLMIIRIMIIMKMIILNKVELPCFQLKNVKRFFINGTLETIIFFINGTLETIILTLMGKILSFF